MDRYDNLILEIIFNHQAESSKKERIGLRNLEKAFWENIESDDQMLSSNGRVGERITRLYISGLIENKNGYRLTRKGKGQLQVSMSSS